MVEALLAGTSALKPKKKQKKKTNKQQGLRLKAQGNSNDSDRATIGVIGDSLQSHVDHSIPKSHTNAETSHGKRPQLVEADPSARNGEEPQTVAGGGDAKIKKKMQQGNSAAVLASLLTRRSSSLRVSEKHSVSDDLVNEYENRLLSDRAQRSSGAEQNNAQMSGKKQRRDEQSEKLVAEQRSAKQSRRDKLAHSVRLAAGDKSENKESNQPWKPMCKGKGKGEGKGKGKVKRSSNGKIKGSSAGKGKGKGKGTPVKKKKKR